MVILAFPQFSSWLIVFKKLKNIWFVHWSGLGRKMYNRLLGPSFYSDKNLSGDGWRLCHCFSMQLSFYLKCCYLMGHTSFLEVMWSKKKNCTEIITQKCTCWNDLESQWRTWANMSHTYLSVWNKGSLMLCPLPCCQFDLFSV